MFDMQKIGRNISEMRKRANLTQSELADRMGISFQAVSNWERGNSCPDISKLSEISEVFGCTIDELLGNRRTAEVAKAIGKGEMPDVTAAELADVAPMLKPDQISRTMESLMKNFVPPTPPAKDKRVNIHVERNEKRDKKVAEATGMTLEELVSLAPFVSSELLGSMARKLADCGDLSSLVALAPFMDEDDLAAIVRASMEREDFEPSSLVALAPFMDEDDLTKLAGPLMEKHGLNALVPLLPFIDDDELARHMRDR